MNFLTRTVGVIVIGVASSALYQYDMLGVEGMLIFFAMLSFSWVVASPD